MSTIYWAACIWETIFKPYDQTTVTPLLTSEEKDDQDDVGEDCGEVDHFSRTFDSFDETRPDDDPSEGQTTHQLPPDVAHVVPGDIIVEAQHAVSVDKNTVVTCTQIKYIK